MLFYAAKIMRHPRWRTRPSVLLTDRNDLDDQLFDEVFAPARILPETPVQADVAGARARAAELEGVGRHRVLDDAEVRADQGGSRGRPQFPMLSDRRNIVVIADEAHRTQYDLIDGLARQPARRAAERGVHRVHRHADRGEPTSNTRAIFGEYIDVYDLTQAVEDGATVQGLLRGRLAKVELPEEARTSSTTEFDEVTELAETETRETAEDAMGTRRGDRRRREAARPGRGRHRRALGEAPQRPHRQGDDRVHEPAHLRRALRRDRQAPARVALDDDATGKIKVVMTGSAADGPEFHRTSAASRARRELKERAKDPDDPLELVIVRDMWLTGFDAPSMHTMYVDKPMQGAGLMQAIARVNRTFRDKPGGLVVDYIGIAESLCEPRSPTTPSGTATARRSAPRSRRPWLSSRRNTRSAASCSTAVRGGRRWTPASDRARIEAIMAALEHLLGAAEMDLPDRFLHHARDRSQAFTLAVSSPEALRLPG